MSLICLGVGGGMGWRGRGQLRYFPEKEVLPDAIAAFSRVG